VNVRIPGLQPREDGRSPWCKRTDDHERHGGCNRKRDTLLVGQLVDKNVVYWPDGGALAILSSVSQLCVPWYLYLKRVPWNVGYQVKHHPEDHIRHLHCHEKLKLQATCKPTPVSLNQLIFVMVKCGVLFEVRTEILNNI
jgi:hypothetical protein